MSVTATSPDVSCRTYLPGATFIDAYSLKLGGEAIDAPTAAERVMSRVPWWVLALLGVRNVLVAPFGLRGSGKKSGGDVPRMGLFPLLLREPNRVVLGMNDKHLDFRLVIDTARDGEITSTTLVQTHNVGGRIYLALILPFHRLIVPQMMKRAVIGGTN